jgi:dihydroorotate dehydrogenase electron transfer subunit
LIRAVARVESADAQSVIVQVPDWPAHRPGQFAMLSLDPHGLRLDPLLPRPMAVFRREGASVEFRFHVVGRGTALLAGLPPGAEIGVLGPLGNGFAEPVGRPLLVGGGTGTASLYELAQRGSGTRMLLGGRSADSILGLAEFQELDVELQVATEDGSAGRRGLVTDLLDAQPGDEIFACGPTAMMRAVYEHARIAGVPCRVSLESRMACGFGICLGCAVPTDGGFRYVCTHGPVFDAERLDWKGLP